MRARHLYFKRNITVSSSTCERTISAQTFGVVDSVFLPMKHLRKVPAGGNCMGLINDLISGAEQGLKQTLHTPLRIWLTIMFITAALYVILRLLLTAASYLGVFRPGKAHELKVKIGDDQGLRIGLNSDGRKSLGLSSSDYAFVRARPTSRAYLVRVVQRNRGSRNDPGNDGIELTSELKDALFPSTDIAEDERKRIYVRAKKLSGFSAYWLNPNEQVRFANRLAVAMGFGIPLFQLLLSWSR